jgi:hypothetical protein
MAGCMDWDIQHAISFTLMLTLPSCSMPVLENYILANHDSKTISLIRKFLPNSARHSDT